MDVLVTYDISTVDKEGERRLATVARICEGYGTRVQYSVFECRLGEAALVRLVAALARSIEPTEDRVHIYRFAGSIADSRTSLGQPVAHEVGSHWMF